MRVGVIVLVSCFGVVSRFRSIFVNVIYSIRKYNVIIRKLKASIQTV